MTRENFTPTPNILFDRLLRELSNSELKILLVIIRQTNGWINKETGNRKTRDRITHGQFVAKTGLSRRIITEAVNSLSDMGLIQITDVSGRILNQPFERKGKFYIYYSSLIDHLQSLYLLDATSAEKDINICKNRHQHAQKVIHNKRNYNKRNYNKRNKSKESRADYVHIKEILEDINLKMKSEIKE